MNQLMSERLFKNNFLIMNLGISAFCVHHTRFKLVYFKKTFPSNENQHLL